MIAKRLVCCSPWECIKELDVTAQLNNKYKHFSTLSIYTGF